MIIFVTGGAGFIGSAVIRHLLDETDAFVVNIDKLTYASNLESVPQATSSRYVLARQDICQAAGLSALFEKYQPHAVMHLAAESHVDRSIDGPSEFIQTNIVGTFTLLQESLHYWRNLDAARRKSFRFLMSQRTKSLVRLAIKGCSRRQVRTLRIRHMLRVRPRLIIWSVHGAKRMNCPASSPIVPTIMGHTIFPKN